MKAIRIILRWIGYLAGALALLVAAQIGWGIYREPIAKKEAQDFCATIQVGQSTDGIQERAIESGAVKGFAKWREVDGTHQLMAIYVGMPPFSRHTCVVKATTVVLSAEYSHID